MLFGARRLAFCQCDNCPTPHVVIYGVKMKVPIPPADSAGFYTTPASQKALANWISLDTLVGALGSIMATDPDKGCISWTENSLVYQMSGLPDSLAGVELEGDTASDVPPSGKLKGVEYLIWGELDSSGGKYHFHVYLEDGYSRDRISSGEADFKTADKADSAASAAISAIEPVFGYVRTYQLALRDSIPNMALKPKVTVIPSGTDLNGNQTIPVTFQVTDCDGTPLKNVSLFIGASQGSFDNSTVTTGANGQATANFTADNVTDVGTLKAMYYPYITPTRKQKSASGGAIVYINNPNKKIWEMDITGSHSFRDHTVGYYTDPTTGAQSVDYYSDTNFGSSETVKQYLAAEISDSAMGTDFVYFGSGEINLTQTNKSFSSEGNDFTVMSSFTTGWAAKTEDFISSYELSGYTPPGSSPEFALISEGLVDEIIERETSSKVNDQMYQDDTTMTDSGYPDVYPSLFQTYPPNPHVTSSFSGNASGYTFTGNYSFDTTDAPTPSETETISFEAHVTVSITPYKNLTPVRSPADNIPRDYRLYQNYPNPFNPSTMISYDLPKASVVSLTVYDILGREVKVLIDQKQSPGKYGVKFDGTGLSSGVYFCRLSAGSYIKVMKMLLLK